MHPTETQFFSHAYNSFGLALDRDSHHYVEIPCLMSRDKLAGGRENVYGNGATLTNPLIFLTGIREAEATPYTGQSSVFLPSVALVVGQYGLGKTELMHQLCDYILSSRNLLTPIIPLPIRLAACHSQLGILSRSSIPTREDFARLLFHHMLDKLDFDLDFITNNIVPKIQTGEILLILDGLDELIFTPQQHKSFFSGLAKFLESASSKSIPQFNVVVSLRFEYLLAMDDAEKSDLVRTLNKVKSKISIYFLRLEFFDDQRIREFLYRADVPAQIFDIVKKNQQLLEILRRPLLLKLFCELISHKAPNQKLEEWLRIKHVGELFDIYIEHASGRMLQDKTQQALSQFHWNVNELAKTSLRLYQEGREDLEIKDIFSFLDIPEKERNYKDLEAVALPSIHKLPFLRWASEPYSHMKGKQGPPNRVRFAHRAFQEFFIAKGMALELDQITQDSKELISFDKLVLNVDMRKFLRYIVGDERWYERTHLSYGLENLEDWEDIDSLDFEKLEHHRRVLLDFMTDLENPPKTTLSSIRWFLKKSKRQKFHPCYLMYNYEAVAVYLRYNWWKEESRSIGEEFNALLHKQLDNTLAQLNQTNPPLRELKELLVERIISVAQRLRYNWVEQYGENSKPVVEKIYEETTKRRVQLTLERVRLVIS